MTPPPPVPSQLCSQPPVVTRVTPGVDLLRNTPQHLTTPQEGRAACMGYFLDHSMGHLHGLPSLTHYILPLDHPMSRPGHQPGPSTWATQWATFIGHLHSHTTSCAMTTCENTGLPPRATFWAASMGHTHRPHHT